MSPSEIIQIASSNQIPITALTIVGVVAIVSLVIGTVVLGASYFHKKGLSDKRLKQQKVRTPNNKGADLFQNPKFELEVRISRRPTTQ